MQKITPFLWFDHQAEEAAKFYTSLFKNSQIENINYYAKGAPLPEGTVMTVTFQLEGQKFTALNGGPEFAFTPAISFFVNCESQEEVDWLWDNLSRDGEVEMCGWLKDKYGISWQIVPTILGELLSSENAEKASCVMKAMLQMKKLDIEALKRAYEQS